MKSDLNIEILEKFWWGISNPFEGAAKISHRISMKISLTDIFEYFLKIGTVTQLYSDTFLICFSFGLFTITS